MLFMVPALACSLKIQIAKKKKDDKSTFSMQAKRQQKWNKSTDSFRMPKNTPKTTVNFCENVTDEFIAPLKSQNQQSTDSKMEVSACLQLELYDFMHQEIWNITEKTQ